MTLLRLLTVWMICLVSVNAMAETMRDPTQLPVVFAPIASSDEVASTGPVLQSIILSDESRAAIINGQRINIGDEYGQAILVALTENSATLQSADGKQQVLKMPHISFGIKQREERAYDNSHQSFATKNGSLRR